MCRLALVDWLSNQLGSDKKDLLYHWVFAFSEEEKQEADEAITQEGLWDELDELVRRVRVCDPACGSGSFLVGMMLVLDDLQARCNAALGRNETPYECRKRILQDQLYGVDVMEWAVRVAELRLWLQLVVETELEPAELHFRPLLPNLDLKLRPGDSLLQAVGDLDFSPFRRSELPLSGSLKGRLTRLRGKKRRFFQGEEPSLTASMLKQEELSLFQEILFEKIHELDNRIKNKRQDMRFKQDSFAGMEGSHEEERERRLEIEALEQEKARYKQARDALRPDQPPPFVWDLSFVEIFEDDNPGFDIVIGNPPYVRQEKIRDYLDRFARNEYLQRLNEGLRAIYPAFMGRARKVSGRADYYVYFYLHGLSLLADRGTFCFITSNSWLDVDFGKDLQEFFLRHGYLKMVIDNRAKRSFAQADVNTVIVLAGPPERKRALTAKKMQDRKVRFVAFRVPFEEALSPVVFNEIEDENLYDPLAGFHVLKRPEFRAVLWDQRSLYEEGLEDDGGKKMREARKYEGDKWGGKYLRAPDIFFTILEKGGVGAKRASPLLVRLGDIAEVRPGCYTGLNDFFYLDRRQASEVSIDSEFLSPVIRTTRQVRSVRIEPAALQTVVFTCNWSKRKLQAKGKRNVLSYIEWGEKQRTRQKQKVRAGVPWPNVPTVRKRSPGWWAIPQKDVKPAQLFLIYVVNDRFIAPYSDTPIASDRCFHRLWLLNSRHLKIVAAILNSTLTVLFMHIGGRWNLGQGAMKFETTDARRLLCLDPDSLPVAKQRSLKGFLSRLSKREIKSIFEELGFPKPNRDYSNIDPDDVSLDKVLPDRRALDKVVFEALGLTEEEQLEVYRAVVELVKSRLVKARSV